MKVNFEFEDKAERELVLKTIAIGAGFISGNLDDIEANLKASVLQQVTQQFQRGKQIGERMGKKKSFADVRTNIDFRDLDSDNIVRRNKRLEELKAHQAKK